MKILKLLIAMLGIASISSAAPVPPTSVVPKHLAIGGAAVVETLAQADTLEVYCTASSATTKFFRKVKLTSIASPDDIIPIVQSISPSFDITDAKDFITLTGIIRGPDSVELFRSERTFQMEKLGYGIDGEPRYQAPSWAGDMYFVIQDLYYHIDGATEGYMIALNGDIYQLNVIDGMVQVSSWMNYSGQFSELVINNGQYRFDMITGDLMKTVIASIDARSVQIHKIENAGHDGNIVSITPEPQYGTPSTFKVNIADWRQQSFQLQVDNQNDQWWLKPLVIKVARLDDLKPGGIGWTKFPYQHGMWINVPTTGVWYIYPEYKSQDIGQKIMYPRPTTPSTGGGGSTDPG